MVRTRITVWIWSVLSIIIVSFILCIICNLHYVLVIFLIKRTNLMNLRYQFRPVIWLFQKQHELPYNKIKDSIKPKSVLSKLYKKILLHLHFITTSCSFLVLNICFAAWNLLLFLYLLLSHYLSTCFEWSVRH